MPIPAMVDVVVVELPTGRLQDTTAALDSCELNLGAGHCRTEDEVGSPAAWHAIVTWLDAEQQQAHVELHRLRRDGPLWSERDVTFSDADSLEQRYRALGLLIAFYVVAGDASSEQDGPAARPSPAGGDAQRPVPARAPLETSTEAAPFVWGLDALGVVGSAPQVNERRLGGTLRGWVGPFSVPLRPLLSLAWASSSATAAASTTQATWFEGSVGSALCLELFRSAFTSEPRASFELRAEALGQRLRLGATQGDNSERRWLSRVGARTGLDVSIGVWSNFAVVLGAQASFMAPEYSVEVAGQSAGEERFPTWDAVAGIRFSH